MSTANGTPAACEALRYRLELLAAGVRYGGFEGLLLGSPDAGAAAAALPGVGLRVLRLTSQPDAIRALLDIGTGQATIVLAEGADRLGVESARLLTALVAARPAGLGLVAELPAGAVPVVELPGFAQWPPDPGPRAVAPAAPDQPGQPLNDGAGAAACRVVLLGGFAVTRAGRTLPAPSALARRAVKLVALAGGSLSANALAEGLWPDTDAHIGRVRLRNVLARLHAAVGPLLVRAGASIRFATDVEVDVAAFEHDAGAALGAPRDDDRRTLLAERALARYRGELLPGDRDADWAAIPRERLRRRQVALLDLLADDATRRGDWRAAADCLGRAIEAEPYDEHRYVAMARLLAGAGRTGSAADAVRHARAIVTEMGLRASPELLALERDLAAGEPVGGPDVLVDDVEDALSAGLGKAAIQGTPRGSLSPD